MSLVLDVPPALEQELAAEAARLGLPLTDYALQLLSSRQASVPTVQTGAELVAYWQREGVIGSRGDILDSARHARQLRAQAEQRQVE